MAAQLAYTSRTAVIRLSVLAPAAKKSNLDAEARVPLPSSSSLVEEPLPSPSAEPSRSTRSNKSFKLHIGGVLNIPSPDANGRPQYTHPLRSQPGAALNDPFEGLPFRALAERFGEQMAPALQAAREDKRRAAREGRSAAAAVVEAPPVPHFLPFTRWAAQSEAFRATFVSEDDPNERKKARLSWYHPDDTMVPRDWFRGGLMADLKYYMPFGLGAPPAPQPTAVAQ